MTLLLKSKNVSGASLGNVSGNSGAQDYVGILDFSRGEYYTKIGGERVDYSLQDSISVSRSGDSLIYYDRQGVEQVSQPNTPSFLYDSAESAYGIFVGESRTNLIDTGGATATIPSANTATLMTLSWEGTGTVSLDSADLTSDPAFKYYDGKKTVQRYYRSRTDTITASVETVGNVSKIQLEDSVSPSENLPFNSTVGRSLVKLGTPFLNLIGNDSTIIIRMVYREKINGGYNNSHAIAAKNNNGQGGFYLVARPVANTTATTGLLQIENGGAVNSGQYVVSFNGTARNAMVGGIGWAGMGAGGGAAVFYGLTKSDTTPDTSIDPVQDVFIGGDSGSSTVSGRAIEGIITHCLIYDRLLSDNELAVMSTMWQS